MKTQEKKTGKGRRIAFGVIAALLVFSQLFALVSCASATDQVANAQALCEEGKFLKASQILESVRTEDPELIKTAKKLYKTYPLLKCKAGETISFATIEQDADPSAEEPIEWIVLAVEEGDQPMALLLSKKVIGSISARSKSDGNMSYANSNIHEWCESDFYSSICMGNDDVKKVILMTEVSTEPSSTGVDSGEPVKAHAFAPSVQDIEKYLANNEALAEMIRAEGTPAVKNKGTKVTNKGFAGYWLRNAGESEGFASAVTDKGDVIEGSGMSSAHGVRPMIWVKLG